MTTSIAQDAVKQAKGTVAVVNETHLTKEAAEAVKAAASAIDRAEEKRGIAADHLASIVKTPENLEWFRAPKGRAVNQFRTDLIAAIVASFNKDVRDLLSLPTKEVPESKKEKRRYWQMQIGSKVNDFKRAVERRLVKEESKAKATPDELNQKDLFRLYKRINDNEPEGAEKALQALTAVSMALGYKKSIFDDA